MKFGTIICATLVGIVAMSSQSLGQQKTAKALSGRVARQQG